MLRVCHCYCCRSRSLFHSNKITMMPLAQKMHSIPTSDHHTLFRQFCFVFFLLRTQSHSIPKNWAQVHFSNSTLYLSQGVCKISYYDCHCVGSKSVCLYRSRFYERWSIEGYDSRAMCRLFV